MTIDATKPDTTQTYSQALASVRTNEQDAETRLAALEAAGALTAAADINTAKGEASSLAAYLLKEHTAAGGHDFTSIAQNLVSETLLTPVYVSAQQWKVAGADVAARFPAGTMLRFTISGSYAYSEVQSASYSGGDTTITMEDAILTAGLTAVGKVLWYVPRRNDLDGNEALTDTVANATGSTLNKVTVVHVSGLAAGGEKQVAKADATDATKLPVLGILGGSIANGATGVCVLIGAVTDIDTSAWTVGTMLYLGTVGALTSTKPANGVRQPLAVVTKSHATAGTIHVLGQSAYQPATTGWKNQLYDGRFDIWNEGTNFTNPANGTVTAEGWKVSRADGAGVTPSVNVKQNTAQSWTAGAGSCVELEITSIGTAGAGRFWSYSEQIEEFQKIRGKTVTFSIAIKASTGITTTGSITIYDGVSYTNVAVTSITTSEAKISVTKTVSASASELRVIFYLLDGATAISTTGSVYITDAQLEVGPESTDFEVRPFAVDLTWSQRYFCKSYDLGTAPGTVNNYLGSYAAVWSYVDATQETIAFAVRFPVTMRATPTVTMYSPRTGASGSIDADGTNDLAAVASAVGVNGFYRTWTGNYASPGNQATLHFKANARL
jgi:hypothetical protein